MLFWTVVLGFIAGLGLIGCGAAYGYRRALAVSEANCSHLRAHIAHLQGGPVAPSPARALAVQR